MCCMLVLWLWLVLYCIAGMVVITLFHDCVRGLYVLIYVIVVIVYSVCFWRSWRSSSCLGLWSSGLLSCLGALRLIFGCAHDLFVCIHLLVYGVYCLFVIVASWWSTCRL